VNLKVAFQGEHGAFSEEAARIMFGPDVVTLPQRNFDDMFAAVIAGAAGCAMAPIENTLAGSVIRNYDLLLEHDLTIVGEVVLRVVHNLIALPGVTLPEIKRVYSHPVALAQCERFFAAHPGLEVVSAYDTAGSVKMLVEGNRRDEAAIAGAPAAQAYGAHIVTAAIESNSQNFTRFYVLARPDRAADFSCTTAGQGGLAQAGVTNVRKTSIVFRIGNKPGVLYRSLAAFADEGIDLTKIESRPIEGRPWEYSFYLDFLGDRNDPPIGRALARLAGLAENLRLLGSYPKAEV